MSEAISSLVDELESADPKRVAAAAQALAQANESIQAAAIPLVRCVGTIDEDSNEWIVSALEQLESPQATDAEQLTQVLTAYLAGQANTQQAYWAVTLLGRIGPVAGPASCQVLASCAGTASEPEIVAKSTWALAQFGSAAAPARAVLEELVNSPVARTARYAQQALDNLSES